MCRAMGIPVSHSPRAVSQHGALGSTSRQGARAELLWVILSRNAKALLTVWIAFMEVISQKLLNYQKNQSESVHRL